MIAIYDDNSKIPIQINVTTITDIECSVCNSGFLYDFDVYNQCAICGASFEKTALFETKPETRIAP